MTLKSLGNIRRYRNRGSTNLISQAVITAFGKGFVNLNGQ